MKDEKKIKKQLIDELIELRQKVAELVKQDSIGSLQEIDERNQTKRLLRESEESFRALTENSQDVIMRFDFQCQHLYVNSAVERETGITAREFIGKTHKELGFPEHLCDLWEAAIQKVFATGELSRIEFELPNKTWIDWLLMPELDHDGSVNYVITAARDITERKHMEQELKNYQKHLEELVNERTIDLKQEIYIRKKTEESLRESEERFRALTENTSDWIWEVDQSFVFTYTSPKVKDLLGYEQNEIIGKTPFDLMPENEVRRISEIAHSVMASRKPFTSLENVNLHKDGHKVIIETSGIPIFDKNGNFSGYRGIDRDITERKRSEEALQESKSRLQTLSDNLPNGLVYQIDSGEDGQQRRFSYISAGVEKLHGITVTEALNNAMSIYGQVIKEDLIRLAEEESLALANMVPFSSEARLQLPSGEIRWRLFTSAHRRLPNNHLVWDGIEIDITERKQAEEALKEKERELEIKAKNLEEANIALKVLLKKMDEDKIELEEKVLLNVKEMIVPYLEKLKMSGLDESQKTFVSILESSLTQITSPFSLRMSSKYFNFTPKELQIVNLLRQGKTNKEIGELLNSSPRTIACHRENIRKKLGLKNKKANLKSYLLSVK